jgi:O-antigen/teichoic acid export membrane protein
MHSFSMRRPRRELLNSFLPLADQALVSGVNFVVGLLLARAMGPAEFGTLTLAWMVLWSARGFQQALIISPMMVVGPKHEDPERASAYFSLMAIQAVIFDTCCSCLILVCANISRWVDPGLRIGIVAMFLALTVAPVLLQDFFRRYFFTTGRLVSALITDALCYLGQLAIMTWLYVSQGLTTERALIAVAATSAVASVIGGCLMSHCKWRAADLGGILRRQWRFSRWLAFSNILQWTTGNIFVLATGIILGPAPVGAIRASWGIMGVTHVLLQALENVVPVHAALRLQRHGFTEMWAYVGKILILGMVAMLAFSTAVVAAPEFWLHLFYGDSFSDYAFVLRWYAATYPLAFLCTQLSYVVQAMERTKAIFVGNLFAGLFGLLCAYPLVAFWGIPGALTGIGTGYVIVTVVVGSVTCRRQAVQHMA